MAFFTTGAQLQAAINALPTSKKGGFNAFDGFFYGGKYLVNYSGTLSPLEHFVQIGADRGFAPNAQFDPVYYKAAYADLASANLNAADLLFHFLQFGLDEGRAPNATLAGFNGTAYLAANPDVATFVDANLAQFGGSASNGALAHFVKFGQFEGRTEPGASTGNSFNLTIGQDTVNGTAGNDTFTARIFDNQNTLQSGDAINGGTGSDTLVADIGNSQNFAITPELNSVETVKIRVQAEQFDSGDNNIAGVGIIDAERSVGVTHWESNNSRADLIVEDVRIAASQITKDITIAMVETDPGQVDYAVYFDQYSLRAQTNTSSTLTLQLMDTRSQAAGTGPLKDSPYQGFAFNLTAPGAATPTLVTLTSQAIDDAKTYADLVTAINAVIATKPELAAFTASLGGGFTVSDTLGSLQTGTEVVLTANDGSTVSAEGVGTGWIANGAVPPSSGLHTIITSTKSNTTDLVTSKVILDDVGRGSNGGDLVIGGLSVGDTSGSLGVQRFEIEVRDNSKLQTINSTNNTLKEVVIKNGVTTSNSFAYVATEKDAGSLSVNGLIGAPVDNNAPMPGSAAQHNAFGFSDVRLIDGSAMTGKLAFTAEVTQASIAKYLNLRDVQADPAADNIAFQYSGGANNDTMTVVIDSAVAASRTLTGREDFTFTANGGAGNDTITVDIGGQQTGAWYADQKSLKNITINGGSGNDTVRTLGSGDFRIDAGADNDTVYINNDAAYVGAQWIVGAANANLADLQLSAQPGVRGQFMYNGNLTVVFSGANAAAAGGLTTGAAAALTNGFEKTVKVQAGTNYAASQYHVNQAIKEAINSDPVLSKLMLAVDGPGTTLVVQSLVAGEFAAADLDIVVTAGPAFNTLPAGEQSSILAAYKAFSQNSNATIADAQAAHNLTVAAKNGVEGLAASVVGANGTNSTDLTDNNINLGLGNDVVVLSTSANSNDVLTYTGYGQGVDTIVNFSTAGSSIDFLDFSAYLDGKSSVSGSTASAQRITTTINGDTTVEANSVTIIDLAATTAQSFANLTEANLKAAINSTNTGTADYAGINAASLNALTNYTATGAGTTLVGGTGKAIVLVQNTGVSGNAGQYKAFELTFNGTAANTTADFSDVKLIAEMDFGSSLAGVSLANLVGSLGFNANPGVVVAPTFPTLSSLSAAASVNEGATATFTLNTSNVADGTVIAYALSGINAADVVGGLLTGTATVTGNVATVNVALANDNTTEGAETLTLTAALGAQSLSVNVTVNDTSTTPAGIPVPATGATGTAAADTFTVDVAAALADVAGTNYLSNITGFSIAADRLQIDLPSANAAITTLAALNGEQGVTVQDDPFNTLALINFGNDANGGDVVTLQLVGITPADWANVVVQVV